MCDMRCINENSAFKLYRTVYADARADFAKIFTRDWDAIRAMKKRITMFNFIDEIRPREKCIYIGITDGKVGRAMITLFYRTGRGHISARTSVCRIIAWVILISLTNIYSEYFSNRILPLSSSSSMCADADAIFSSTALALGKRNRSTLTAGRA